MPLIQLDTSFSFPDQDKKQSIAKTLSQITAEGTGKPEQYVMASINDGLAMVMSGASGPGALITIKAIGGLSKSVNQALAGKISQLLQKELNIPTNRIYITFEELSPAHWAWGGKTFD